MSEHEHRWGDWLRVGQLPDGRWEYVRQCLEGECQETETMTGARGLSVRAT